ncbi:MAG: Maf family protein [Trueperella sp.]|nr:Maf family protein [Trueperella sp.]
MKQLLLASASPARFQTLKSAGIVPEVQVSAVDEDAVLAQLMQRVPGASAAAQVQELAHAKATAVAQQIRDSAAAAVDVIVGCDSMLELDGEVLGKPHTPQLAQQRLAAMRGRAGQLHTGHCVIDSRTGEHAHGVSTATVYIAEMTDAEITAYINSGEPLEVAGSFTIDGLGGSFIEKIDGDPHGVVGISLPLLRSLMAQLGHQITDFWRLPN